MMEPISFQVDPSQYRHWDVTKEGQVMTIHMSVDPDYPLRDGYDLKLNSYDLGVDI